MDEWGTETEPGKHIYNPFPLTISQAGISKFLCDFIQKVSHYFYIYANFDRHIRTDLQTETET
jgi:hypothetical protein